LLKRLGGLKRVLISRLRDVGVGLHDRSRLGGVRGPGKEQDHSGGGAPAGRDDVKSQSHDPIPPRQLITE